MTDTIVITYWEGDDRQVPPKTPFTKMINAEWTRNGVEQWARADDTLWDAPGKGEVLGIPDDVRETLALLIAPSLSKRSVSFQEQSVKDGNVITALHAALVRAREYVERERDMMVDEQDIAEETSDLAMIDDALHHIAPSLRKNNEFPAAR